MAGDPLRRYADEVDRGTVPRGLVVQRRPCQGPVVTRDGAGGTTRRRRPPRWAVVLTVLVAGTTVALTALGHRTTPATWYLPAGHVPNAASSTLDVLVLEVDCSSGKGAAGDLAPPEVTTTADTVVVEVRTYVRIGAQNCLGSKMAPLTVDLGEPLGDRVLVDPHGSRLPDAEHLFPQLTVPEPGRG